MRFISRCTWLTLSLAVLALIFAPPALAADAGPQSQLATACEADAGDAAPALDELFSGDGVVWTSGGCTAQLTCESNCVKACTGQTSCHVGSNYVECDGVRKYCPSCNVNEFPGFPPCNWRLCTWCVCVNQGGSTDFCCYEYGT